MECKNLSYYFQNTILIALVCRDFSSTHISALTTAKGGMPDDNEKLVPDWFWQVEQYTRHHTCTYAPSAARYNVPVLHIWTLACLLGVPQAFSEEIKGVKVRVFAKVISFFMKTRVGFTCRRYFAGDLSEICVCELFWLIQ